MINRRPLTWTATLLCVITLCGCSKTSSRNSPIESSSPTQPSPPAPPAQTVPSTPVKPVVVSIDILERTATLSFRTVAESPRYVIEIGTSPEASNVATLTTDEGIGAGGTFTRIFTNLPAGFLYARAKAQNNAGTGAPSAELKFLLQDLKYLTETLFLQSGLYGVAGEHPGYNVVRGFRKGARVTIRVSTSVTAAQRRGLDSL